MAHSPPQSTGRDIPTTSGKTSTTDPNVTTRRKTYRLSDPEEESSMEEDLKKMINARFDKVLHEIRDIKEQYRAIEASLTFHAEENTELKKKLSELEKQNKDDRIKIELLENRIEDLERGQGSTSIEIRNIPKASNENLITLTENVFRALKLDEKPNIRKVHRAPGKPTDTKPIILELNSHAQKETILEEYKKQTRNKDKRLRCDTIGFEGNDKPVYISEVLTQKMKNIFYLARQHRKLYFYKHCWTSNGRVYLRKDDGTPYILIKSEAQLSSLEMGAATDTQEKLM